MNSIIVIIMLVLGIGGGVFIFYFLSKKRKGAPENLQSFLMLQNQIQDLARTIDQKLSESTRSAQEHMQYQSVESNKIIRDLTERLTKLDETNRQVLGFSDQLRNLQDILKNPKQRGVLGEYYLEAVLKNVLPPGSYQMQYKFSDELIVDAVIFIKDKIIPIDSKFSLENYNRILESHDSQEQERLEKLFKQDLKHRIDETAQYVKPEEGTMDFAFMFIPAEGIYYDLLINQVGAIKTNTKDLIEYAFSKKVIIVSPTSFLAYLQTVLQGLRALQIEESAKEIRKNVEQLGKHIQAYDEHFQRVGKNLGIVVNAYNGAQREFKKIDKDVLRITGETAGISDPVLLERPEEIL